MTAWLDKLNLQPQERRLVLGGVVIVALVLNYWLVWPYFGEWSVNAAELAKAESRKMTYLAEIGRKAAYERQLKEVEKAGAGGVLEEEQANRVQSTIYTQAATRGVTVTRLTPSRTLGQTNLFFDEVAMTVEVVAGEGELVNFLHALGSGDSMIRVRDLARLRLDPTQTKLQSTLTLVASFQKKAKAVAPPSKPSASAVVQPKGPAAAPAANRPVVSKPTVGKPAKKSLP
jgi:type II secretory pathway component PulM